MKNGMLRNLNHSPLELCFPLLNTGLSNLKIAPEFWNWEGNCGRCGKRIQSTQGTFCCNFAAQRGPWTPCRKAWCGSCYRPRTEVTFYTQLPEDEDGNSWLKRGDQNRFKHATNGEHMITHFQCDLCHFQNMVKRNPNPKSHTDNILLTAIRRANIDAFWARERTTV